jgi:hypothetical protein
MAELLSVADLEAAKKQDTFHSEVITGKAGGVIGGADIDYSTNGVTGQVQKTLPKILDDIDWSYVGLFADGVTFTKRSDFAVDAVGIQWVYVGAYPFTATAGTVPAEPTYQAVHVRDHNSSSNLNAVGGHDAIYDRSFGGVAAMKAYTGHVLGLKYSTGSTLWRVVSYTTKAPLTGGLFAQHLNALNLIDFGGDRTGVALSNNALNDAADVGPVYVPQGTFRIENFTRRITLPNVNIGQEQLICYGDPSLQTLKHQFMAASSRFHGDGNMFLSVVNYAFLNIGVRNALSGAAPAVPGYLFSMYGQGLEAGVFIGCYFGESLRHFNQTAAGAPSAIANYMIGPNFDKSTFFHAQDVSRNFDGVIANYTETGKCYTAHCKAGLKSRSPGPGLSLNNSIFEYINDYAIDLIAYGFVANYSVKLESVFFESCGGNIATINGVTSTGERARALPSVRLSTESAGGAKVTFTHNNTFTTYTGANPPVAWFDVPTATTTYKINEQGFKNGNPAVLGVYTQNLTSYADPFPQGSNKIFITDNDGLKLAGRGSSIKIGGIGAANAPLDIAGTGDPTVAWLSCTAASVNVKLVGTGVGAEFGSDATVGFYISEMIGSKDVTVKNGNLKTLKSGKGLTVVSPDGLITKTITLSNAGAITLI